MRRLTPIDKLLLATLFPLWVACFSLYVREALRDGGARVPIFAVPDLEGGEYPRLGGSWPEIGSVPEGLSVGDRLLRVGDVDLSGAGYLSFNAFAVQEAGANQSAALVFEHAGQRRETTLQFARPPLPGYRVPALVAAAITALFVLLRARSSRQSRLFFAAMMAVIIFETPAWGGSYTQTYFAFALFNFGGGIALALLLRWVILFPEEVGPRGRISPAWCWLVLPNFYLLRINYFLGGPLPTDIVPGLVLGTDVLYVSAALGIMTWNYRRADPVGRRRIKWLLYGSYLAVLPLLGTLVIGFIDPEFAWFQESMVVGALLISFAPLSILVAVVRFNLFDIDRLISATASYTVLMVGAVAALLTAVPRVAAAASSAVGWDSSSAQAVLSVMIALLVVPLDRRLRPRLDRFLQAERFALERGIESFLRKLSGSSSPEEIMDLVGARLEALFKPESCAVYARSSSGFAPAFVRGMSVPPEFESGDPLIAALERREAPLAPDPWTRQAAQLDPFERAVLETLGVAVVLPVRSGGELKAFVCLGIKRSGDIYTSTDITLLSAVAETTSSALVRFKGEEILRRSQAAQDALRRYVPGAVADRIVQGKDMEAREREVSILFVDIRGYTTYSEPRRAEDVFSTVNRYTESVSRLIRDRGGSLMEFSGDGMMAVFGAPDELPDKERTAVETGRAIVELMESGAVEGVGNDSPPLAVGVGIATGPAFVGNIKAADRWIWTAIGDTVNVASRLQNLCRDLEASIVVDSPTRMGAGIAATRFELRESVRIRGRAQLQDLWARPFSPPGQARESGTVGEVFP